jgi:hypothetical protein
MSSLAPRLLGYGLVGLFCLPGPLGLLFALDLALHRARFVLDAVATEGTVTWMEPVGTTRTGAGTCVPVFRYTAGDGRMHIVNSDVSVPAATFQRGERVRVLYLPGNPEAARIDAIWTLWQESLVVAAWGTVWSSVPVLIIVARRRAPAARAGPSAS